jgi:hypothetical protein
MRLPRRIPWAAVYIVVLAAVNFYLCRGLFVVSYTGHTNSIQGLWISMARLAGEHWFRPSWWPYQDAGVPFEHTYMPLLPASSAIVAKLAGVPAARAFFTVMGMVLCLGPVTLFLMLWRMSGAPGCSFWAALAYSVTSPARALLPELDVNPIRYWSSLRLYGAIVWDDLPHHAAVCFLPLALLFIWRAIEKRLPRDYVLAILFIALTVLPSVFGATALCLGVVCMLLVLPRKDLAANLSLLVVLAFIAYLVVSPFLPPSLIATIRSNQQNFPEDRWSAGSFTALSVVVLGCVLLLRALDRAHVERHVRFFIVFAFVTASVPIVDAYLNRHFIPQPNRYTAEMEIGVAMLAVPLLAWLSSRLPHNIRSALAVFVLCVAAEQVAGLRAFVEQNTRPVDPTQGIEYRVARWIDGDMPGRRVMVPGSIAQWCNVFSDTPQLSGASYSTTPNWTQQEAMKSILTAATPAETAVAVLWLKAFGVQAATAVGHRSPEFWKGPSSTKFDGLLPVLWRQEDTSIYGVPQRSPSLAHVIPADAIAKRTAAGLLPLSELSKYVAALDDPALPLADMRWESLRRASIETTLASGQFVSVQTGYHRGWHARANGHAAAIRRDGLGFLLLQPDCAGQCHIELTYDGGWEYNLCRLLSLLAMLGLAAYAWTSYRSH